MSFKIILFGFFAPFISSGANADVLVGIEHNLPIEKLQFISKAIELAANRESPDVVVYLSVSNSIFVSCPPMKPDRHGNGCNLLISPASRASQGQVSFLLRKPLEKDVLIQKTKEIVEKLASTDANATTDHIHIGNPLYSALNGAKDSTHYYCVPEGEAGKKAWQCYLSASEEIGRSP